jgi:hypothetical protein
MPSDTGESTRSRSATGGCATSSQRRRANLSGEAVERAGGYLDDVGDHRWSTRYRAASRRPRPHGAVTARFADDDQNPPALAQRHPTAVVSFEAAMTWQSAASPPSTRSERAAAIGAAMTAPADQPNRLFPSRTPQLPALATSLSDDRTRPVRPGNLCCDHYGPGCLRYRRRCATTSVGRSSYNRHNRDHCGASG